MVEFGVALRIQRSERQILELLLETLHAETVRERRVDLESFVGDPLLLLE